MTTNNMKKPDLLPPHSALTPKQAQIEKEARVMPLTKAIVTLLGFSTILLLSAKVGQGSPNFSWYIIPIPMLAVLVMGMIGGIIKGIKVVLKIRKIKKTLYPNSKK